VSQPFFRKQRFNLFLARSDPFPCFLQFFSLLRVSFFLPWFKPSPPFCGTPRFFPNPHCFLLSLCTSLLLVFFILQSSGVVILVLTSLATFLHVSEVSSFGLFPPTKRVRSERQGATFFLQCDSHFSFLLVPSSPTLYGPFNFIWTSSNSGVFLNMYTRVAVSFGRFPFFKRSLFSSPCGSFFLTLHWVSKVPSALF